ncbi:MAG TPA: ATP-binding protein [Syntrophomonadaceae bacterium]|nr:ATP-binding protein [Syntrophomonadaceae bacterium]
MKNKFIQLVYKQVRIANSKYNLIEDGDQVAVGMSGGKDSSILLYFLDLLKKYTPIIFNITPIYVDLGWNNEISELERYCNDLGYELFTEPTDIGEIVYDIRQERNPCSLCANLRRGALNNVAKRLGCNKVALGHHLDDVVNTLFMSMLYENKYQVFKPKTYLDRVNMTVIRPLIYVEENSIIKVSDSIELQPVENKCPVDGFTKRTEVAGLVNMLEKEHPGAKRNILTSIENVNPKSFWKN